MKYEDWIKYERLRQDQTGLQEWVTLPPENTPPAPETSAPAADDKNRVWTMVVQIFNSRRI